MNTIQRHLLLPFSLSALFLASSCSSSSGDSGPSRNLAQTLGPEGLTSLRAALERVGLLDELTGGTLTLFGPNNAAFALLPDGFVDDLTDEALTDLLLYHLVVGAAHSSSALAGLDELTMANDDDTIVDVVGGGLHVNEGRVVKANVQATNGTLHVINRVLMPPTDLETTLQTRGLLTLLELLGEIDTVNGSRGKNDEILTLMAPTDDAFDDLPKGFLDGLSVEEKFDLVAYHAMEGKVVASEALAAELVPSIEIDEPDIRSQNLLFGLGAEGPTVNGASILLFNIPFTDGVLYILDEVLLRPDTIMATIEELEGFSVFTALLQATPANIVFSDPFAGPFTVFAPTDEAFDDLEKNNEGLLQALLDEPGRPTLIQILQYHTVSVPLTANDLAAAVQDGVQTLEGSFLTIAVTAEGITVDGANVEPANVLASNGVIHVVDAVLLPEDIVLPP